MPDNPTGRLPALHARRARLHPILKVAIAIAVVAVLGFLFLRSLRATLSEPYTVERERMRGWTIVIEPPASPSVLLALRPAPELVSDLFRQVFTRAMESLAMPPDAAIPLVMRNEFQGALAGTTLDALATAARKGGLESVTLVPRCLGYRRVSQPGSTRQLYFVLFDAPELSRFRQLIGTLSGGTAPGFDPSALSPVLFIAASDGGFGQWLPMRVQPETDCVAPVVIAD